MQPLLWICRALPALALMLGAAGAHAAERAIDKTVEVAATLDQTWSAWTTRQGITSFFARDAKIEARVGGAFQISIDPLGEPGM